MTLLFRVKSAEVKIAAVETWQGGNHQVPRLGQIREWQRVSPTPSPMQRNHGQKRARPLRVANKCSQESIENPRFHKAFSPSSVVAASELPPPRPPPMGKIFFHFNLSAQLRFPHHVPQTMLPPARSNQTLRHARQWFEQTDRSIRLSRRVIQSQRSIN